jgi:hypothetical protein
VSHLDGIKKTTPLGRLIYWIQERETIRIKKEAGVNKPWTLDPILQSYRFCNVRRMDDKVSRWLLDNWYTPNIDHPNILVACTLARQLNNPKSLADVGFPRVWNPRQVEAKLNKRAKDGLKNFSGAYMITGTLGGTKIEQVVWKVVDPIHKPSSKDVARIKIDRSSMEKTVEMLIPCAGFSTFIAGQVTADLRWATIGSWQDKDRWAPIGPGSRRGMNRLLGKEVMAPMKQAEFTQHLGWLIDELHKVLPGRITERLEAHDYQNCLCEFDKYTRTLFGEGRPKQKYPGV